MWMAHATAFFNRETTHFNGCSFFILNSDYKTLQQYMDSIEQPKIIIQPLNEKGCNPQATIDLAAKVAASFDTPVTHTKATYDYEKVDLETAYKANKQTFQVEVARAIAVSYKDTVKLLDDAPRSGDTPTM